MSDACHLNLDVKKRFSVDNHGGSFHFKANNVMKQLINYDTDKIKVRNSYRTSNIDRSSLNLKLGPPKTKLEKVVENLKEIMYKFKAKGKENFHNKAKQVIYELLSSNTIYRYDDDGANSKEIEFLEQYTSGCFIKLEDKLERADVSKYQTITVEIKNQFQPCLSLNLIKINDFGVNFDVFSYSEKVGRKNMFINIAVISFSYKEVNKLLKTTYLNDYLLKLWEGYTSQADAFYHNVRLII